MTVRAFEHRYWYLRCYINFIAEFLAAEESATRAAAIAARAELKEMDVPKDYASWVKVRARRR
jgi:hypothetical protein